MGYLDKLFGRKNYLEAKQSTVVSQENALTKEEIRELEPLVSNSKLASTYLKLAKKGDLAGIVDLINSRGKDFLPIGSSDFLAIYKLADHLTKIRPNCAEYWYLKQSPLSELFFPMEEAGISNIKELGMIREIAARKSIQCNPKFFEGYKAYMWCLYENHPVKIENRDYFLAIALCINKALEIRPNEPSIIRFRDDFFIADWKKIGFFNPIRCKPDGKISLDQYMDLNSIAEKFFGTKGFIPKVNVN